MLDFHTAIFWTEILLAISFIQQSLEHLLAEREEQILAVVRILLSVLLLFSFANQLLCFLLLAVSLLFLIRFQGPYHGGADKMSLLTLCSLCLIFVVPDSFKYYVFAYLALQVLLSYFISGLSKSFNKDWWSGLAFEDLFAFSVFPASENLRKLAELPKLSRKIISCSMIAFELCFPLVLINHSILLIGLALAFIFHIANAYLFGFNRFTWAWLAAYPSLIWFQAWLQQP